MTMRRDAIYPSIVVGKPPQEDAWLGKATERIFLPAVRMTVPEIVDYDLPVAGAFHNCVIVSIRKAFPGHARKVMHALWGLGMLSLTKAIVVVDAHVDVHDYEQVFFYVGANVDPKRDVVLTEGPLDHLDHAPTLQFLGGKIGIDATAKGPEEGARPWPRGDRDERRRSSALVDRRWAEYGIPADARRANGSIRHSLARCGICCDVDAHPSPQIESSPIVEPSHEQHDLPGPEPLACRLRRRHRALLVGLIVSPVARGRRRARARLRRLWVARPRARRGRPLAPERRGTPERARRAGAARAAGEAAMPAGARRALPALRFLEGATLGLGAVIGGIVTFPVVGFAVVPPFLNQGHPEVDLGPLETSRRASSCVATFMENPTQGEVSRRTAYIRNNGLLGEQPSFTIISNRCAHLGCPVQPGGPLSTTRRRR